MSRWLGLVPALCLFAACDTQSDPEEPKSEPRAATASDELAERACRVAEVRTLATALSDAQPRERKSKVAEGLKAACDVPPSYVAFLDATEPDAKRGARFEAAVQAVDLLDAVCPNPDELTSALGPMKPSERPAALFDRCGLGSTGLVERAAWLAAGPSSVVPFAAKGWLEAQGVAPEDAKTVAGALLLRDQKRWSSPDQKLPMVEGTMPPVPAASISVEVSATELRIEGVRVLSLEKGSFAEPPEGDAEDPVTTKLREALLAEREALDEDATVTLAVSADATIPSATVVRIAALSSETKIDAIGLVAHTELAEFGFVPFSAPSRATPGHAGLRIDADGFHVSGPSGKIEDIPAPYDFSALDAKAFAIADAGTEPLSIFVDVADSVPTSVLISTFARLGQRTCDGKEACRSLTVRLERDRRAELEAIAMNAGILGALSAEEGHFLASPYGGAFAGGDDDDVWGGLTGTEVGEAFGVGGLGLVGTGRGGGGTGEGSIGLGNAGLIGKGSGKGSGSGGKRVPRVRQSKATVKGALDKDIIRRIVRAHINEIRVCYDKGLLKDAALAGKVVVDFTIGSTGKVTASSISSTTLSDKTVGTCIAGAVKRWKFPSPMGGGVVLVKYPFSLDPA